MSQTYLASTSLVRNLNEIFNNEIAVQFFKHYRSQMSVFLSLFIKFCKFLLCQYVYHCWGIGLLVAHLDFNCFLQPCFFWDFYNQMPDYYYVTRILISISVPEFEGCRLMMGVGFSNWVSIFLSSCQWTKCIENHTLSNSLLDSYNPNYWRLPTQILSASHTPVFKVIIYKRSI